MGVRRPRLASNAKSSFMSTPPHQRLPNCRGIAALPQFAATGPRSRKSETLVNPRRVQYFSRCNRLIKKEITLVLS